MAKDVRTADEYGACARHCHAARRSLRGLWEAAGRELSEKANHTEMIRYMERLPKP